RLSSFPEHCAEDDDQDYAKQDSESHGASPRCRFSITLLSVFYQRRLTRPLADDCESAQICQTFLRDPEDADVSQHESQMTGPQNVSVRAAAAARARSFTESV